MREEKNCSARGFINAARLHADKTVFNHVNAPDAVLSAELVERLHHFKRRHFLAVDGDAVTFFKIELDKFRCVGSVFRSDGEFEHRLVFRAKRVEPRIFHNSCFVGNVEQIAVHRIRLFHARFDGKPLRHAVIDHFLAPRELRAERFVAPRSDDFQIRSERGSGELKAHLVVALARRTVSDGIATFRLGDFDHTFRDERTRNRRAEEVLSFVNRSRLHHRENEVAGKFFLQIFNVNFGSTGFLALFFEPGKLFFLSDVRAVSDHFGVVFFFNPGKEHGRVQSAGICEKNLHSNDCFVWLKSKRESCAAFPRKSN